MGIVHFPPDRGSHRRGAGGDRIRQGRCAQGFALSLNDEGAILLTPLASIPRRELLVWENEELKASLYRGLADAAEGKVRRLDWLTEVDDNK